MKITTARETVEQLWCTLGKRAMGSRPKDAAEIARAAAASGWIAHLELEVMLLALEPRLYEIRLQVLLDAFGIAGQWVCSRPGPRSTAVLGIERVAATDAARLLIHMERLGLAVDPAPLCALLLPSLKARPYLTAAELAVFWHERERHRSQPLEVAAGRDLAWGKPSEALRTAAGYRVEMFRDADGRPAALRSVAPGRRKASAALQAA